MPTKSVVDANIFINYFRQDDIEITNQVSDVIVKAVEQNNITVFVPDIAFHEVLYNLKKKVEKNIFVTTSKLFLDFIKSFSFILYKFDSKEFDEIRILALDYNLSIYDASYFYLSF